MENPNGFNPNPHLAAFKSLSQNSSEYQGHGWGCAWLDGKNNWQLHHNIQPVWENENNFPDTSLFVAHARSAFRDEGIIVENNMPFTDDENIFVFNGELRGVKIRAEGRIGAEKIFNTIKQFDKGNLAEATSRTVDVINKRTRYIRAMNFFLANRDRVHVCSQFAEEPDYFQLHTLNRNNTQIICSRPYEILNNHWQAMKNNHVRTIQFNHH